MSIGRQETRFSGRIVDCTKACKTPVIKEDIEMTITGRYEKDTNFIYVYTDNVMYTIAKAGHQNYREYGALKVDECSSTGHVLTQEMYNEWESRCEKIDTFVLSDHTC